MKRNKALAERLTALVGLGNDAHIAARSLGMTPEDVDEWISTWPWFAKQLDQADAQSEVLITSGLHAEALMRRRKARARRHEFERLRELSI